MRLPDKSAASPKVKVKPPRRGRWCYHVPSTCRLCISYRPSDRHPRTTCRIDTGSAATTGDLHFRHLVGAVERRVRRVEYAGARFPEGHDKALEALLLDKATSALPARAWAVVGTRTAGATSPAPADNAATTNQPHIPRATSHLVQTDRAPNTNVGRSISVRLKFVESVAI